MSFNSGTFLDLGFVALIREKLRGYSIRGNRKESDGGGLTGLWIIGRWPKAVVVVEFWVRLNPDGGCS